jgi:hypothetical protein
MILTQQKLILALRELPDPIRVGPATVHAWIRAGCPTVPCWKRSRFILPQVLNWLQTARGVDPLEMDVGDRLYRKSLKG